MKYDLIHKDFQQKNSSAYQLSILIGVDSLVYSVCDTNGAGLLLLKSIDFSDANSPTDWADILRRESVLDLSFRKVKVAMFYSQSALVPARLFNEAEKSTYLNELTVKELAGDVQNDHMESLGLQIVYSPKSALGTMLAQKFPTAKFYNGLSAFLLGSEKMISPKSEYNAFAHFFDDRFYFSIYEKKRLLFCNTFSFHTDGDVMYFILLALEQHGVSADKIRLRLSGNVVEQSDIYKILYRYVLDIDFLSAPEFLRIDGKFASVPTHFFSPLHALVLL